MSATKINATPEQIKELTDFLNSAQIEPSLIDFVIATKHRNSAYSYFAEGKDYRLKCNNTEYLFPFSRIKSKKSAKAKVDTTSQPIKPKPLSEPITKKLVKSPKSSFTVRIDDSDRAKLEQIANDRDIPISQLIRAAVKTCLKEKLL